MVVDRLRAVLAPVAVLTALAVLVLPSQALAAPGATPPPPGQATGPAGQPGKPEEKPAPKPPAPVWTGTPGTNLAHDNYGYPWPAAPDCDESNVGSGGCVNDGLGFFQGQCTSWVAQRLGQRNGFTFSNWYDGVHWGDAVDWRKAAKGLGYRVDKVPATGAVGWYARGHVSYVEDVNADGSVVISEMNTDGHNGFVVHTVYPGESSWPDRFLHLADVVPVDYTAPERPAALSGMTVPRGVELHWKTPADDVGVTGYRVLRNGMPLATTASPSFVDRQASAGQTYSYSVVAHDEAGNVSEPADVVVAQGTRATAQARGPLAAADATVLRAGDSTAICGLVGTTRQPRVGCRLRTLEGWRAIRSGHDVPWGQPGTRAFLAGDDGLLWFCRELRGGAPGCVALDLTTQTWGADWVHRQPVRAANPSWVMSGNGPALCGTAGDRAACTVLNGQGWREARRAGDMRPGDPLSRAFVRDRAGEVAFCRNVEGRALCTSLDSRRLAWGRDAVAGEGLPHGRWLSGRRGPVLVLPNGDRHLVNRG